MNFNRYGHVAGIIVYCLIVLPFSIKSQNVDQAELLSHWKVDTIPGSFTFDNAYNEIWGYAKNENEYAIIGSTLGTHIIDVTNPSNIEELFFVAGAVSNPQIIHRDYHDYKDYLYAVADEGANSTLQIIDLSNLPESIEVVFDDNALIYRAHNIFIDTAQALLYGCITGGSDPVNNFVPLRVFDLTDPINPIVVNSINSIDGVPFSQVHDAYVRDGIAYLNCGPTGFNIADFNDPMNPILLANLTSSEYPQAGYNHSGWLSTGGDYYYMADETHGMDMKVLDVTSLPDITVVDTIDAGSTSSFSIPHNQVVAGDYLYASYYYDGLQVYDISDPSSPIRILEYSTTEIPHSNTYEGAWGVYPLLPSGNILVSDMQEGLFVVKGPEAVTANQSIQSPQLDFTIFPNPAMDLISVNTFNKNYKELKLIDMMGRVLFSSLSNEHIHTISTNSLQSGMYTLHVMEGTKSFSKLFVKI